MKTLTIEWLNKCRCGNKLHRVKTARGNESALWDDDAVKCYSCGRGGVIQVCEGHALVLWETDEEMAEGKPMSTLTKEWLLKTITELEEDRDAVPGAVNEDAANALAAMKLALASLEAEPVAYIIQDSDARSRGEKGILRYFANISDEDINEYEITVTPLYAAPPETVSVPDAMEMDDDFDSAFEHGKAVGRNAYRADMLQAEPVSNSDELPLDYLQGHKDGLEWAAQLAEANHPQTGDWLYDDQIDLARAIRKGPDMPTVQGGNSPVTPDAWISCSERMPKGYADVLVTDGEHVEVKWWDESGYWNSWTELNSDIFADEITHWMQLPEPPQEVNRG